MYESYFLIVFKKHAKDIETSIKTMNKNSNKIPSSTPEYKSKFSNIIKKRKEDS
jgi:hypothetical protein